MKQKIMLFTIILLILASSTLAADFTPQGDINGRGVYDIYNFTTINATYFNGDGSGLTGVTSSFSNSSVNSSQMYVDGSNVLQIIGSWFNNLFYYKNETYTTTEVDAINTSMTSYVNSTFIAQSNEGNLNVNSSAYWDSLNSPTDITSLGTIASATSITSSSFVGPLTGNAATATALASNPTDCSSGEAPYTIDASGNFGGCKAKATCPTRS